MQITRFDLPDTPDGQKQWADIHRRPTHAQTRAITAAKYRLRNAITGEYTDVLEVQDVVVLELVERWLVFDEDGTPIEFGPEGVSIAPQEVIQPLYNECDQVMTEMDKRLNPPAKDDGRPNREQRRAATRTRR